MEIIVKFCLVLTLASTASSWAAFDIILSYNDTPTAAESAAFAAAESTWESIILGYLGEPFTDPRGPTPAPSTTLTISVNLDPIDGAGGILGSAGPSTVKSPTLTGGTYMYTDTGVMTFDTADTASLAASGSLGDVILHEMAHVIGIGTLWSSSAVGIPGYQELYVDGTGQYTGANALAAYQTEFGQTTATFVPVELGGGGGTANGHWNEVNGGAGLTGIVSSIEPGPNNDMRNELMTGWLNAPSFISNVTIGSLNDLGYDVVYNSLAIPEPQTALPLLILGVLATLRNRRRKA